MRYEMRMDIPFVRISSFIIKKEEEVFLCINNISLRAFTSAPASSISWGTSVSVMVHAL